MDRLKLCLDIATAAATVFLAVAAWVELPLITAQVKGLADQIKASREATAAAEKITREWETLKACQRYDFDRVIDDATARIWSASNKGTDYAAADTRDIITLLNYLDGLATGVAQGLYIEEIVKYHLGSIVEHAYKKFIESSIVTADGLESFIALHNKWFVQPRVTAYKT